LDLFFQYGWTLEQYLNTPYDLIEDLAKRIIDRKKENIWKMALAFNDPRRLHEILFGKTKADEHDTIRNLKRMGFVLKE
jgi:hypothetical protein